MLETIVAGVSGLNSAIEFVGGFNAVATGAELNQVKWELTGYLLTAQQEMLAVRQENEAVERRVTDLEKRIDEFADWSEERQTYALKDADRGALVYMRKPGMRGEEPAHWLCADCYHDGKKSFLQSQGQQAQGGRAMNIYACGRCRGKVATRLGMHPSYGSG